MSRNAVVTLVWMVATPLSTTAVMRVRSASGPANPAVDEAVLVLRLARLVPRPPRTSSPAAPAPLGALEQEHELHGGLRAAAESVHGLS